MERSALNACPARVWQRERKVEMNRHDTNGSSLRKERGDEIDIVCLSHLRWDFVFQRPQHLLTRAARERRVFFIEEPILTDGADVLLDVSEREGGVKVVVPHLPKGLIEQEVTLALRALVDGLLSDEEISDYVLWYYTPMARAFTRHLKPRAVIYDCMDELSAFKFAPPALREYEAELFDCADHVFAGGQSLYEAKRDRHPSVRAFPSSIDVAHFAQAREIAEDPADQAAIPHPRLGNFGVIDERFDVDLVASVAQARPDWHFVIVGPIVKIDPQSLPKAENIHYLGGKDYKQLPSYIAGWDVALLLFARNESTRYISPTKTPEYLAAGRPVVSTSIRDVVRPYGDLGLVHIADTPADFIAAIEDAMTDCENPEWREKVDAFLANTSWDRTWGQMRALVDSAVTERLSEAASTAAGAHLAPPGRARQATSVSVHNHE
jgi:UDP-galactopyranose mutase